MVSALTKPCLLTGASGFVGSRLSAKLAADGCTVWTLSRRPTGEFPSIAADLRDGPPHLPSLRFGNIYHLAGAAHYRPRTTAEGEVFQQVNVQGLRNLLTAIDRLPSVPHALVLVSSVAVYGLNRGELLDEGTLTAAQDPYGRSKRLAEEVASEWAAKRGVRLAVIRLPLVVGRNAPGNWAKLVDALRRSRYLGISDGSVRRSMVLAQDVAAALPLAAGCGGVFHLTDGVHPTLRQIEDTVAGVLGVRTPWRLSLTAARTLAGIGDIVRTAGLPSPFYGEMFTKLTSTLTFDDSAARKRLGWNPRPVLGQVAELV